MAQVPATSIESTSLGDVAEFTIPFPFLSRAEVFVTVDGATVPFTWINDDLVQLSAVPELGAVVRRYRSTAAYVPLHQFSTGVPFLPRYVDRDFKQTLYAVQESVNDTAGTASQALATAEESLLLVQDAFDILGARTQYIVLGPYAAGLHFETTSQVFSYLGEFYAPGPSIVLPYTTTGVGAGEVATFRSVGDAILRSDLADSADPAKGASLVGHSGRTLSAKLLDMVSVKDFGAVPDGSAVGGTDNTAAFNAALATGRKVFVPSGDFRIKGTIIVPPGASLVGDGRTISNIFVTPDYDTTVSAFIRLGHNSEIRDIGIKFVQPDSSNRATLTAYPWAIDFNGSSRVVIDFVRVSSAWDAITGTGNTGGSYIGFIEVGALNTGLTIDGALDFFHGLKWHFWPFFTEPDLANATNLLQAYGDGQATAVSLGAVDGFNVENIATFQQKLVIKTNANAVIPNLFGHIQLDGNNARLIVSGGVNAVGKLYDTKSSATTIESVMVGGEGVLDVGYFRVSSDAKQYSAKVYDSAKLHIHSGDIQSINQLGGAVFVQGGIAILEDCTMNPAPGAAYSNAYCVNANGIMKVRRCRWTTRGAGSGIGIFFVPDNIENEAVQNFLGGWGLGWNFSGRPIGIYANNTGANYDFTSNDLTGCIKSASYQATSDAAGKLTLPHGVLNLQFKLLRADAYCKGNSGEASACAVSAVDPTNLYISGAQPSRAVRVSIQYTDNPLTTW